ncbi:hypothetical protein JW824_05005 [bacterium]|nr:hypothetical protein [bacterium]RQV96902.1 MAG: hypothetical protein EH221_04360 [bacterium]
MNHNVSFKAPWGSALKFITALCAIILIGIPLIGIFTGQHKDRLWILGMIVMPLSILIIASFFMIRGYALSGDTLLIHRLGWESKLNVRDLVSIEVDPEAMSRSIRTWGNGGLFCFAGLFRNKKLGSYRAFATDPKRAVVLKFPNRTIVVTPDKPEVFLESIKGLINI